MWSAARPGRFTLQSSRSDIHRLERVDELPSRYVALRKKTFFVLSGKWAGIHVVGISAGWTVRESIPGWGEIFRTRLDRPWGPHSFLCNGYRLFFPEVKRPGRSVITHYHLAPRLKKELSYTSTPPLGLHGVLQVKTYLYLYLSGN